MRSARALANNKQITMKGTLMTQSSIVSTTHVPWALTLSLLLAAVLSACGGGDNAAAASATQVPRAQSLAASSSWSVAAQENGRFQVSGTRLTRYGVEGHWVEKSFTDSEVECSNATYGDPVVGTVKECQVDDGVAPTAGSGASITVQAASQECEGRADLALTIKGTEVTRWRGILGNARDAVPQYQALSYQHASDFALADVEIAFVNDYWTPSCNRNVRVASVAVQRVGGSIERVELAKTTLYSTGTWSDAEKCSGRNVQSEWLDCNGAFRFAGAVPAPNAERISVSFQASDENFVNPERGMHDVSWVTNSPGHKATTDFSGTRGRARSLVRAHIGLDEFKGGAISEARLNEVRSAFAKMREQGLKALPIVSYTFPVDGTLGSGDAPLNIVKSHLDQLKPVYADYKDVIAVSVGGFIGPWGEWHSSSNGLDKEPALSEVYNKMLEVIPAERMLQARTVDQLRDLPGRAVDASTAYDRSKPSRTGMVNLCFLVNQYDAGTYYSANRSIEENKSYLGQASKFTPVGGETCQLGDGSQLRDDCSTALTELRRFHFSFLNPDFYERSLNRWKAEGCYSEIERNLGYRFTMLSASVQKQVQAGQALPVSFVIKNGGYAAPFNPRALAVVLRNKDTGARYSVSILQERSDTLDPRKWYSESGEITVSAAPTVPADVPAGSYDVLLSLHDPMPSLSARAEYSIRLANKDVWEANTGLNKLVSGVTVTR
jgi:hypothetical protein